MNHRVATVVCICLVSLVGCASDGSPSGVGTAPGDADAAVGDRGPRRTGTATSDAPTVQDTRDQRINAPTP